jgi:hypothetical protein
LVLPLLELLELDELLLDRLLLLLLDRLLEDFRLALLEDFRLALLEELLAVRRLDLSSDPFLRWDLLEG